MLKVFYHKSQSVSSNVSFSPSAGKPEKLIALWKREKQNIKIIKPLPLTIEDISLAHDVNYVRGILEGRIPNGFMNQSLSIADSLIWTTGSLASAALHSIKTKETTCSPTSGFHHACYDHSSGYCTFNGLVIAAQILKTQNLVNKVGILDCDMHYGDGTDDIIKTLNLDYIRHWTFGGEWITKENADLWLETFPGIVREFKDCDIVIYQAGADPHINDPLGGTLTTEQMKLRDRIVFSVLKEIKVPVVWNLAGGYQNPLRKVLELHTNTLEETS